MQLLPLLGTALLVSLATYVAYVASQSNAPVIPLVTETEQTARQDSTQRPVDLVPTPRTDGSYAEITARPLFVASRRPSERMPEQADTVALPTAPAHAPKSNTPDQEPDLRLLGVMTGGARNAALLASANENPEWRSQGADIQGWTLTEIAADHVILKRKEATHRVELYQR